MRVGIGYDVHRLVKGRPLILGGVTIPSEKGLLGYSDADVLLHAICDALLGAAGEGDIGRHFPDTDPRYQGISSLVILEKTFRLIEERGYRIVNIDSVIILEVPKIQTYVSEMKLRIAQVLHVDPERINIKSTTSEGLGWIGNQEGAAAYATVCLVEKIPKGENSQHG